MVTDDGWPLALEYRPARGGARAQVLCGHAMFCNRRTLDKPKGQGLASTLAERGFDVWMLDVRAHGGSGPSVSRHVSPSYDDVILRDLPAAIRWAKAQRPDLPLFLLGHSLCGHGGVAAVSVDRSLPLDGIVSLAGNVWIPSLEPDPLMWAGKRAQFEAWAAVTQLHGYFPAKAYNAGTESEGKAYVMQFTRNARKDRWGSIDGRYDYLRLMAHLTLPILSVVGSADTWMCTPQCARLWLEHATRADVTYRVINEPEGIDHMGLVLNPAMKPIWHEIADWIVALTP